MHESTSIHVWRGYRSSLALALIPALWLLVIYLTDGAYTVGLKKLLANLFSIVSPGFLAPTVMVVLAMLAVGRRSATALILGWILSAGILLWSVLAWVLIVASLVASKPQSWTFIVPTLATTVVGVILTLHTVKARRALRELQSSDPDKTASA